MARLTIAPNKGHFRAFSKGIFEIFSECFKIKSENFKNKSDFSGKISVFFSEKSLVFATRQVGFAFSSNNRRIDTKHHYI